MLGPVGHPPFALQPSNLPYSHGPHGKLPEARAGHLLHHKLPER